MCHNELVRCLSNVFSILRSGPDVRSKGVGPGVSVRNLPLIEKSKCLGLFNSGERCNGELVLRCATMIVHTLST